MFVAMHDGEYILKPAANKMLCAEDFLELINAVCESIFKVNEQQGHCDRCMDKAGQIYKILHPDMGLN